MQQITLQRLSNKYTRNIISVELRLNHIEYIHVLWIELTILTSVSTTLTTHIFHHMFTLCDVVAKLGVYQQTVQKHNREIHGK